MSQAKSQTLTNCTLTKRLTEFAAIMMVTLQASGQGRVVFNNFTTALSPITITTAPNAFNPSDGPPGAFVGSNYSASLFFVNGTVSSQAAFDRLGPIWRADALFFGTTGTGPGHGIGGDLSGFFEGGQVLLIGQAEVDLTVQVRAWYNGGGLYGSYGQALAAGHNVGQSNLLPLHVPPLGPAVNLGGLLPFTVGIPEPSTGMLVVLGGAALLLFRCRNKR